MLLIITKISEHKDIHILLYRSKLCIFNRKKLLPLFEIQIAFQCLEWQAINFLLCSNECGDSYMRYKF